MDSTAIVTHQSAPSVSTHLLHLLRPCSCIPDQRLKSQEELTQQGPVCLQLVDGVAEGAPQFLHQVQFLKKLKAVPCKGSRTQANEIK